MRFNGSAAAPASEDVSDAMLMLAVAAVRSFPLPPHSPGSFRAFLGWQPEVTLWSSGD